MMEHPKTILLVSCYELGHQPAGICMPLAFLKRAGYTAEAMDLSTDALSEEKVRRAGFIGISVPMHTALRLAMPVAREIRRLNPAAHVCFYGLYASLNADYLLGEVADSVIGGEFEERLVELIEAVVSAKAVGVEGVSVKNASALPVLKRLEFPVPERSALPPLERYARLEHKGEQRLAGYTEASRGCLHHCTHCPIPPVYGGRFFAVPQEAVIEDVRRLVEAGARHITFGDPDFLNGPTHSLRIARAVGGEFPGITFDFTAKVEHVIKHGRLLPEFARNGCIFIVSAVESLSDTVLGHLEKGHTRKDVFEAFRITRGAGISLRPSFVSFTPWTTVDDYVDMLEFVEGEGLIDQVDPVQYTIRLLVPPGSLMLARAETRSLLGELNQEMFTYEWAHPDPRMDDLHKGVSAIVERGVLGNEDPAVTFYKVRDLAYQARGGTRPLAAAAFPLERARPPRLTESWFC